MIISTLWMWLLLLLATVLYFVLPAKYRWSILLIGSMFYLGYYSVSFLVYATVFALANYFFGRIIKKVDQPVRKKRLYLLFLILNIGQLVFYKYIDFLIQNVNWIAHSFSDKELPYLDLLVPIGISYFTFQSIGYVINVYRGLEQPEKHLGYFLIYNLFFPKILSGPIERSERFLPQLRNPRPFSYEDLFAGFRLILFGMFKKLVIAERLGVMVNKVYGDVGEYSGWTLLFVLLIQAIYIYSDFSGYTDMALGIARLFGINLTDNFNRPFLSRNVSEFWRRWHISLSNWCNDYIFKTVIFKRRRWGKWASVYAIFLTFLVIGIWHGPMWTFLILGLLQGIAINYEFFTKRTRLRIGEKAGLPLNNTLSRIFTYLFFSFSLIFFFAHSLGDALYFTGHLFDFSRSKPVTDLGLKTTELLIGGFFALILIITDILKEKGHDLLNIVHSKPFWLQMLVYYLILVIVLFLGKFNTTNFIYFQF
ncbi:MAG: MBOAT family O-acyltransferase [Bacteroidota bacterium]